MSCLQYAQEGLRIIMNHAAFLGLQKPKCSLKAQYSLLFLDHDSPALNPIKYWSQKIKSILKPLIEIYKILLVNVD
ncbi:hypothetical protein HCUR_00227 [Holospora curviuscula]|uniref:Uncharacterized protein n=2 Tax=Holospora curviuscula TaxID=1082868 RepID=A0A2S5RE46_9PROT|nr:hypothetical protein HCUR_00227 [Holospora curviuscula]